ncbi:hypothetical protein Tco_0733177 [Tanacetum coccineum]
MSHPKNLLKSLHSKPGECATKFISIDGKPMMARRSVTDTQPSRVEGKAVGKDGNPLRTVRQAVGDKHTLAANEKGDYFNAEQEETLDEQPVSQENAWEDPKVHVMKSSFVNVVSPEHKTPKINFRSLINKEKVDESDCVLPVENVMAAQSKFANSLVGFFVGKRVAFHLVQNYVTNTWTKFGFQKVIKDDDDVFYFKFTSITGLEQVLEQGPWLIRNQPLMLTKWTPNLELSKDKVTKVSVWVKIHKVPVVAYCEDGLSLIATQIGKPIMLDSFTSSMCSEPWGRLGFARALIEVSAEKELKQVVTMAVPIIDGEGYTKERMSVEYEWKPPRCMECKVFGHDTDQCPKRVVEIEKETNETQSDGFTVVQNRKKKGKKVANGQKQTNEGVKVDKSKPKYAWNVKTTHKNITKTNANSDDGINVVKLKNHFSALQEKDDVFISTDVGESSGGGGDVGVFSVPVTETLDSESEVEELENEYATKDDNTQRASTLLQDVPDV